MSPVDRHMDPRWNTCLDAVCTAWNRLGPDATLAALTVLAASEMTDEGVVVLEIAARDERRVA